MMLFGSCGRTPESVEAYYYSDTLSVLVYKWNHYRSIGRQDSVIITGRSWLRHCMEARDTIEVQYTGIAMAQAYILIDADYDSTLSFMEMIRPYMEGKPNPDIATMYWNTMGHFALKYELDYAEALSCYRRVLDNAVSKGDRDRSVLALCNIVNIFYVQSDEHGTKYAEEAVHLSRSDSVSKFNRIGAYIAMARMCYLAGNPSEAMDYLHQAHSWSIQDRQTYFTPSIHLLYGDVFRLLGDKERSEMNYRQAVTTCGNSEPALVSKIYLNYGAFCEETGKPDDAMNLYLQGLRVSEDTRNMEFRCELLRRLVILLYRTGRESVAANWSRQYIELEDSLALSDKTQDFNAGALANVEMRHEYDAAVRSLELSESRRRVLVLAFVVVVALMSVFVMVSLYLRQMRMNKELVARYEEYRQRLISENRKQDTVMRTAVTPAHSSDMERLYLRMEDLMKSGAYRDKSLSLEKLAAMLDSNRTYVSNTVNQMAGCSFFQYLDSYRIKEASRVLSDPELSADVSLKALADDVGYSSPQVFHKAFKKETGVTPGFYRAEALKIRDNH